MSNLKESMDFEYESPVVEVLYICPVEILCTSPGAGGSEGTGEENWMSDLN